MAISRGGIVGMMIAKISERVMAVLQAQKNPPRRAGLGKAPGSAAPSVPSATYRSMAYSAPKRKICSCFVLQGVMVLQRRRAGQETARDGPSSIRVGAARA